MDEKQKVPDLKQAGIKAEKMFNSDNNTDDNPDAPNKKEVMLIEQIKKLKEMLDKQTEVNQSLLDTVDTLKKQNGSMPDEADSELDDIKSFNKDVDWQKQVKSFFDEHSDIDEWIDDIEEILKKNPQLLDRKDGLDEAWHRARSQKYDKLKSDGGNPAEMLEQPEFIEKYILNNPELKEKLFKALTNNEELPLFIGTKPGGAAALTPPKKPKNLKEAAKLAEAIFRK